MKFCKDCKHCNPGDTVDGLPYFYAECRHNTLADVVSGQLSVRPEYCGLQREDSWFVAILEGTCGRTGRFFQAK
jgi:hypothetical protein